MQDKKTTKELDALRKENARLKKELSACTGNLENEPVLLLGAGHCFRDQVIEACPACVPKSGRDTNLVQTVEGTSLETIRHMVASGMGLTILPCTAAGADRYSQRLISIRRFASPVPKRQVALAWRTGFPRPRVIDVLRDAITASQLSCVRYRGRRVRRN